MMCYFARLIRGVMRVGSIANGLLLHGDTTVQLVAMCQIIPTVSLLKDIALQFPKQLQVYSLDISFSFRLFKT